MPETGSILVDDDASVRQSLRLCLEASGMRVLGVATADGALEALDRASFDVVFLDLWLGSASGLDVLPEMLRRRPGLGVIVITAHASFATAVEAMKLGASDYVPKPFTPDQIREAARRTIEAQRLRVAHALLRERADASVEPHAFDSESSATRSSARSMCAA